MLIKKEIKETNDKLRAFKALILETNYYLRKKLGFYVPIERTRNTNNMKKFVTALLLAFALPCIAQAQLSAFFSGTSEGVTYCLPNTRLEITVEASCITQTPGEFYSYAERYLHIKNVISKASNNWDITSTESNRTGVPNKEKSFTVNLNGGTASNIRLNDKGIIESINSTSQTNNKDNEPNAKQDTRNSTNPSQYMTEEMLQATSTAKMAELTAKEIYTIRESKLAITRGQLENMPSDGAAIALLLQELDKQEKALTEMFIGRTDTVYHRYTFTIDPSSECDTTKAVLFRFSRKMGILDKENLAGEPIYYDLKDLKTVLLPTPEETAKAKPMKKEGIFYNNPGRLKMTIYTKARKFLEQEIPIAQLGTTEILSKNLFKRNSTTKVTFDTSTGAITDIKKD